MPDEDPDARPMAFCIPGNKAMQRREASRLDALVARMLPLGNVAAPHVGVPLQLVVFKGEALLNPRLAPRPEGALTWCEIKDPLTKQPVRVHHAERVRVTYDTAALIAREIEAGGDDACELSFLVREVY